MWLKYDNNKGYFVSTDGGTNWQVMRLPSGTEFFHANDICSVDNKSFFFCFSSYNNFGVYSTHDGGLTWLTAPIAEETSSGSNLSLTITLVPLFLAVIFLVSRIAISAKLRRQNQ